MRRAVFQAVGIEASVIEKYFVGTSSRIGGIGLDGIARETFERHRGAYAPRVRAGTQLTVGGEYQWRRDAEHHLFTPETVFKLQHATRTGQYAVFKEYTSQVDDQTRLLRDILGDLGIARRRVPRCRSTTWSRWIRSSSASPPAPCLQVDQRGGAHDARDRDEPPRRPIEHRRRGEDPSRYRRDANGDWRRSAVKQVASGRFGVTSEYLVNADEIQIKMAQGAEAVRADSCPAPRCIPGSPRSATRRRASASSPPPHRDIYSIEDLAQLIYDLKNANPMRASR